MARSVRITIDRNHFDAEPLEGDDHFFAEFPGAEQHHLGGARGQWSADTVGHGRDDNAASRGIGSHRAKASAFGRPFYT